MPNYDQYTAYLIKLHHIAIQYYLSRQTNISDYTYNITEYYFKILEKIIMNKSWKFILENTDAFLII